MGRLAGLLILFIYGDAAELPVGGIIKIEAYMAAEIAV